MHLNLCNHSANSIINPLVNFPLLVDQKSSSGEAQFPVNTFQCPYTYNKMMFCPYLWNKCRMKDNASLIIKQDIATFFLLFIYFLVNKLLPHKYITLITLIPQLINIDSFTHRSHISSSKILTVPLQLYAFILLKLQLFSRYFTTLF